MRQLPAQTNCPNPGVVAGEPRAGQQGNSSLPFNESGAEASTFKSPVSRFPPATSNSVVAAFPKRSGAALPALLVRKAGPTLLESVAFPFTVERAGVDAQDS